MADQSNAAPRRRFRFETGHGLQFIRCATRRRGPRALNECTIDAGGGVAAEDHDRTPRVIGEDLDHGTGLENARNHPRAGREVSSMPQGRR
jgi:hypothetical protein